MRRSTLALTVSALLLAAPGVAMASTVTGNAVSAGTATFRAAPGEINDLAVTEQHPFEYLFDDVAFMIAGKGCTSTSFTSATCFGSQGTEVFLKDSDDHANVTVSTKATVWGGAGNDTIDADSFGATTAVYGEGGNDFVEAGGESGQIADGGPGNDTVHCCGFAGGGTALGGPGDDEVRYQTALGGPATIDAGTGDDTVVAQPTGFTASATGGTGDDVIVIDGVTPQHQAPTGYTVTGDDGNDTLVGGPHGDTIDGGAGRDYIDVRDGGADTVTCGAGADIVRFDASDTIDPDCETRLG